MSVNWKNPFVKKVLGIIQHYDENTYWKLREKIIKNRGGTAFMVSSLRQTNGRFQQCKYWHKYWGWCRI